MRDNEDHSYVRAIGNIVLNVGDFVQLKVSAKIWGKATWVMHQDMSLNRMNYEILKFIGLIKNFHFDPFIPTKKLDLFNTFILKYYMRYFTQNLTKKIVRTIPKDENVSQLTFSDPGEGNEDILEALEDTRNESFGRQRTLDQWTKHSSQAIYVTPRFLTHFDGFDICDISILHMRLNFLCMQLGFMADAFCTGDNDKKLEFWTPAIRYTCLHGNG